MRCRTENEFFREIFKSPAKIVWGNIICVKGRDTVVKNVDIRVLTIIIKESVAIKGLKFKDSKVVFGAMIVYIMAKLTFKL